MPYVRRYGSVGEDPARQGGANSNKLKGFFVEDVLIRQAGSCLNEDFDHGIIPREGVILLQVYARCSCLSIHCERVLKTPQTV